MEDPNKYVGIVFDNDYLNNKKRLNYDCRKSRKF